MNNINALDCWIFCIFRHAERHIRPLEVDVKAIQKSMQQCIGDIEKVKAWTSELIENRVTDKLEILSKVSSISPQLASGTMNQKSGYFSEETSDNVSYINISVSK